MSVQRTPFSEISLQLNQDLASCKDNDSKLFTISEIVKSLFGQSRFPSVVKLCEEQLHIIRGSSYKGEFLTIQKNIVSAYFKSAFKKVETLSEIDFDEARIIYEHVDILCKELKYVEAIKVCEKYFSSSTSQGCKLVILDAWVRTLFNQSDFSSIRGLYKQHSKVVWDESFLEDPLKGYLLGAQTAIYIIYLEAVLADGLADENFANDLIKRVEKKLVPHCSCEINADFWKRAADFCFETRKYGEAAAYSAKAFEEQGSKVVLHKAHMGKLLFYQVAFDLVSKKYDDALKNGKELTLYLDEERGLLHYARFMAYSHKGDFHGALTHLEEGIKMGCDLEFFEEELDFSLQKAITYFKKGKFKEAIKVLSEAQEKKDRYLSPLVEGQTQIKTWHEEASRKGELDVDVCEGLCTFMKKLIKNAKTLPIEKMEFSDFSNQ